MLFSSPLFFPPSPPPEMFFSCLTAGDCESPHFPGEWPLLPWSLDNIGGHCTTHVHLSFKDEEATLSTQTHSIGVIMSVWICWVLRESMRIYWGGWVCTPPCVYASGCVRVLGARPCLCVSSLSQPAESAVSLHLTAGQKLEQEMNSDSVSASHKFLFSYSDTKDNISALH